MKQRSRRRKSGKNPSLGRSMVTTGTVTAATLGLTTCTNGGGGVVDPPPPPPLVCADANMGQNLKAVGERQGLVLTVSIYPDRAHFSEPLLVTDVVGATLDSLVVSSQAVLSFTLDSLTTTSVTFTLSGSFDLNAGPCAFTRVFIVTIDGGDVTVAVRHREFPIGLGSDVRIVLLARDGLSVRLEARGLDGAMPAWHVTGGEFQAIDGAEIIWRLPSDPGLYQAELVVDRGNRGPVFDALCVEVT
jgi:hypothetical protein